MASKTETARAALLLGALLASRQVSAQQPPADGQRDGQGGAGAEAKTRRGVVAPVVEEAPTVTYPTEAIAAGDFREVKVVVIVEIDAAGVVTKVTPETVEPLGFSESAVAAAQGLRFRPATRDGQPVAARIKYEFVFRPPLGRIAGRVASSLDRGLPAKVNVTLPDGSALEVETAADGTWSLVDVAPGHVMVRAHALGWRDTEAAIEVAYAQETAVVLRLDPETPKAAAAPARAPRSDDGEVEQVEVRGTKPPREVTKRTLTRDEIDQIPGTNGDALKSLQSLPGVARPPVMGGQLIVRGSAPQDTTIYVDGTEIPLAYHFGGLSSVVPTEALDRIDFFPGNYSTTYGRGTGGIVDIGLRDPKHQLSGFAQIDLIDARLLVEGPIGKSGWTFLAAGRRSWFDVWLKPILEASTSGVSTAPRYYDYQLMVKRDFSARSSLRFVFFGSDDKLEIVQSSTTSNDASSGGGLAAHTGFQRLQAIYRLRYSSGGELRSVATLGRDNVDIGTGTNYLGTTQYPLSLRTEVSQRLHTRLRADAGIDLIYAPYDLSLRLPANLQPGQPSVPGGQLITASSSGERTFTGFYADLEWTPWMGARFVPGLRVDYTSTTASWDLSPRLVVRQELGAGPLRTAVKGGVGIYHQPPTALESDPTYGQRGLRSSRAIQYALGVEQPMSEHLDLSIEGFAKQLDGLVVSGHGNSGEGRVIGTETMLRYHGDPRFFGWLSYTLSRSERRDSSTSEWYRFQYDQTHILNIVGSYRFGRGYTLGGRFRLVSGNPYTPKASGGYDASSGSYVEIDRQPSYTERLPLFHQLDVRFEKMWTFDRWRLAAYADIQNIYNNRAVEGVDYNFDYTTSTQTRGLTILPSLGIRGEL